MRLALALLMLAATGAVTAQTTAPQPQAQPPAATIPAPQPPERVRGGASTLNLQLDDTSRRRIMSGAVEEGNRSGKDLPSLGEGARPLDHSLRSSPYPKQYNDTPALQ